MWLLENSIFVYKTVFTDNKGAIGAELLLLGEVYAGGFGSDRNAVLVQSCDQHLTRVLVIGVKVKHIPHHVGQSLIRKFLEKEEEKVSHKTKAFSFNAF